MDRIIRKAIFIIVTVCVIAYAGNDFLGKSLIIVDDVVIPNTFCETYYESYNNNTGVTTINGMGNVYYNFKALGYNVVQEEINENIIDVCFQKDEDIWRYYYEIGTGYVIFFNNNFESSFNGATYIIERKDINIQC